MLNKHSIYENYYPGTYVPVPATDLAQYRYNTDWLPQKLRQGLHFSGKQEVVLENQFWLLGHFKHHDVNEPVWLAKGLSQGASFDAIYDVLLSAPGGRSGIVLSHTRPVSKRASLPGGYRIIDPYDLLNKGNKHWREVIAFEDGDCWLKL